MRAIYRQSVRADAHNARIKALRPHQTGKARVSLTFCTKGGRAEKRYQPRDVPNAIAAAKALFDGLTDAGLIVDDSARYMQLGTVEIDSKRGPYVVVHVEAIEDERESPVG